MKNKGIIKRLTVTDIFKNGECKPVDMKAHLEKREKEIKEDQQRYEAEVAAEKERLKDLSCPVCKNTDKKHVVISKDNGIIGPGYHSRVLQDYYVCQGCGIMFVDLNKKEIRFPKDDFFL